MSLINRIKQTPPQENLGEGLSQSEIKFILKTLSENKFDGKDVFLVSGLVKKLSEALTTE